MASSTVARAPSDGSFPGRGRAVGSALVLVAVAAGGLWATIAYLLENRGGQRRDQVAMEAVYARRETLDQLLSVLGYLSMGTMAVAMVALVSLALLRARFAAAIGAVIVLAGANLTTQLLKHGLLERPDHGYGWHVNSLPSGHTTATASVVIAALLVAPVALRGLVVLVGSAAIVLTGVSTIVAGWHRPSDVIAACAVALLWGGLVVLGLAVRRSGPPSGSVAASLGLAIIGAVLGCFVLLIIGVRPEGGWDGVATAATVMAVIGLITALSVTAFERVSSIFAR